MKEMYRKINLVYLASGEVFFHCYGIMECAHLYCLCDGYQAVSENFLQEEIIVVFVGFVKNIASKIYIMLKVTVLSWKSIV